ncbi:hypothetical protein SR39_25115 [Methylobacterium radiotolerans]|jgi:hypothetical protein|nr:hypothetical protein SR39_25115 [Methylobacterium radiotolerans]
MRRFIIVVTLAVLAVPAHADTFSYNCRVNGKSLKVKIDDTKNTLTWRGNVYKIKPEESCAKFGWRAERKGEAFNFCTATQGYADFQEGGKTIQCDQDR